jgi:hypothetical protein
MNGGYTRVTTGTVLGGGRARAELCTAIERIERIRPIVQRQIMVRWSKFIGAQIGS